MRRRWYGLLNQSCRDRQIRKANIMYRRSQFTAVLPSNPNLDSKVHPIDLTAAPPNCDAASRQATGEYGFCAFINDNISPA